MTSDQENTDPGRQHAEKALLKSEELGRRVFENFAIGVALTTTRGRFMAANIAYQQMLPRYATTIAIMGAPVGTIGTARAQYHLRQIFVFLNIYPINGPEVMIGNAAERFNEGGKLTDETTEEFIRQPLQNLVDWTRLIGQSQRR